VSFGDLIADVNPALIVVTTARNGERAGCLVGFHAQSSIEPAKYCVWLSKANHTFRVGQRSSHLVLHMLTSDDLRLAEHFGTLSGDDVDKFADLDVAIGAGGAPVLRQCPNRIVLRRTTMLDEGGDHVCAVGEVLEVAHGGPFEPLRLSQAAHLPPGHGAEERPEPPTEQAGR
jgi:flavin reductase (DIM6/NTAB) family NADH-FMN oxidoreductase RutF